MKAEINKVVYAIRPEDVDNDITQDVAISDEFDSVSELREFMKGEGYSRYEYTVVYSHELWINDLHLGTGRGLSDSESRKDLETDVNLSCCTTVSMINRNPERYYY